jgi:hypothetical protein
MNSKTMANAMLKEDFKSSHQDLTNISNESDSSGNLKSHINENDTSSFLKNPSTSQAKQKSVDFAILPPPKRVRLGARLTAKEVVDGTFVFVFAFAFAFAL